METQVRAAFAAEGIDLTGSKHNEAIVEAALLCRRHGVEPADLVLKWAAHHHNSKMARDELPTKAALAELGKKLERSEKVRKTQVQHAVADDRTFDASSAGAMFDTGFMDAFGVQGTPVVAPEPVTKRSQFTTPARRPRNRGVASGGGPSPGQGDAATPAPPSTGNRDYHSRDNSGKVELVYNPADLAVSTLGLRHPKIMDDGDISEYENAKAKPYRHMFQKLRDISEVLDARVDDLGDRMKKKFKLVEPRPSKDVEGEMITPELAHVALPNQEPVPVIARVCLDTQGEGKLNAASVVFEGSRETSNGARVEVNLAEMQDFSLFPGQIVAAEGTNATGTKFTPSKLYLGHPLPLARSKTSDLVDHYFGSVTGTEVVDILVAAGPFTTTADTDYEPFKELMQVIRGATPDVVVLIGPFVDEDHPVIKKGELEDPHEEVFLNLIEHAKDVVCVELEKSLVLVPSPRDVHHDAVYPQPAYQLPESHEHEHLHCMANPSTFTIKEMVVGVNSADILMDLSKQETSRGQSGDRMGRLANHLLQQRSYYPLCPPAAGLNLVYEHLEAVSLPITPDIMLLPSDLRFFAKNVNGSLVVNPGKLTKFSAGGTYAKVAVHAPRRNDIPEDSVIRHSVTDRAVVQVVRV